MKKPFFFLLFLFIFTGHSWQSIYAGQVVTEKDRQWAKQILAQEKSITEKIKENTLAVLYFRNQTSNQDLIPFQKGIAIMLMTDLSKVEKLTLLERTKIQALLVEMDLSSMGLVTPDLIPETGKLLGAERLILGNFLSDQSDNITVSTDIFSVANEKTDKTVNATGIFENLLKIEKEIAFKIIEYLNIELSEKEKEAMEKPMSNNLTALKYFFTGIDLSDQGKYQKAKGYYQKALKLDAGFMAASQAIAELNTLNLAPEITKSQTILNKTREQTSSIGSLSADIPINNSANKAAAVSKATEEKTDISVTW